MKILKKIHALFLVIVFTAGCTIIVVERPDVRRARGLYERHRQSCPYVGFWGNIYWEYMWYRQYPYYSWVIHSYVNPPEGRISKKQLQKPKSGSTEKRVSTNKGVVKKKEVKSKEKSKKVIKKKNV